MGSSTRENRVNSSRRDSVPSKKENKFSNLLNKYLKPQTTTNVRAEEKKLKSSRLFDFSRQAPSPKKKPRIPVPTKHKKSPSRTQGQVHLAMSQSINGKDRASPKKNRLLNMLKNEFVDKPSPIKEAKFEYT